MVLQGVCDIDGLPSHTTLAKRDSAMELELSMACSRGFCSKAVASGCRVNLGTRSGGEYGLHRISMFFFL